MKQLLVLLAVTEVGAGVALLCLPSAAVALLLGSPLDTSAALTLGRVAGTALFSLGVGCWLARHDETSRATRGLIAAMLFYNVGVATLLASAGIGSGVIGVALWPAVVLHAALTFWCFACLRSRRLELSPKN